MSEPASILVHVFDFHYAPVFVPRDLDLDSGLAVVAAARTGAPVSRSQTRLLDVDPATLSADEALDALAAVQEQVARLQAIEIELLVRAAGATRVVRDVLVEDTDC